MDRIQAILQFWFEGIDDATPVDRKSNPFRKWFAGDRVFDREVRERFEKDLTRALAGGYKEWEETPRGTLAMIILCDQMARNMYRGTPRMYAGDARAGGLASRLAARGEDRQLDLIERVFAYMPLMHAEDLGGQRLSVRRFQQIVEESRAKCPENTHYYSYSLDYARKHCAVIERFGRFPHRNAVLGRASTPEEMEFLKKPGGGF